MGLLKLFKKLKIEKALRVGQSTVKFLRKKLEDKLNKSEAIGTESFSHHKFLVNELSKGLEQFLKLRQIPKAIGFMPVDFFSFQALERGQEDLNLSIGEAKVIEEAVLFFSKCNRELERMEVRKDGFVKGRLSKSLLDSGEKILKDALSHFCKD